MLVFNTVNEQAERANIVVRSMVIHGGLANRSKSFDLEEYALTSIGAFLAWQV
jgi:hypothetical protein